MLTSRIITASIGKVSETGFAYRGCLQGVVLPYASVVTRS